MKYTKHTVVMRDEEQGKVLGIVHLANMGGDTRVSCGLRVPKFDYLQFTLNNGKVYTVRTTPTGTVDVDFDSEEYCCSCVKDGRVLARGKTSRFAFPNPQLIKYINEEKKEEKDFFVEISSDVDAFEGRVATYNYYEKELPKDVAQDAEKIVETVMLRKKAESESFEKKKPVPKAKPTKKDNGEKENTANAEKDRKGIKQQILDYNHPMYLPPMPIHSGASQDCPMDTYCPHESPLPQDCPQDVACPDYERPLEDFIAPPPDINDIGIPNNANCDFETDKLPMHDIPQIEEKPPHIEKPKHDFKDETMKTSPQKPDFYFEIKDQLDHLFKTFKEDSYLNEIIPSSKWVRVTYDESGQSYSVGLLTDGEEVVFIGYGVEGQYSKTPPKELNINAQWVPLDFANPQNKGYWMIYQSAKDGRNL